MTFDATPLLGRFALGGHDLPNRMVLAPMSRHRAGLNGVPTDLNVEFYRQRASAGLMISEGTSPSPMGRAYLFTPSLYTAEHAAGWRRVADAVHGEGGRLFVQLMHAGRISDPLLLDGETPLAPSAVAPPMTEPYNSPWPKPKRAYVTPRAMTHQDVLRTIDEFKASALLARECGLDGVEIHAASGYLPMQFLSTNVNLRTDEWGGDVERRAAFLLAIVDAISDAVGPGFVGVKLSPGWGFNQVEDSDPVATYSYLAGALSKRSIAYLHVGNYGIEWDVFGTMRSHFDGPLILNVGFSRARAAEAISSGAADMIAFGQHFIANPDLVDRYRNGQDVSRPHVATYYTQGSDGYTDYPAFADSDPVQRQDADLPVTPIMPE
ncbi:alkene reductase [Sphingobium sp.]|uniref:alkene reductase n=1 Tax=Sphingobium sp. TaxID=1912891 RepID=UPI003B3B7D09